MSISEDIWRNKFSLELINHLTQHLIKLPNGCKINRLIIGPVVPGFSGQHNFQALN